jgi:hypothetical protein
MTTIILVIIGVLIAAASALFMVFYGGSALDTGKQKAEAARLVSEGVQIQAAVQAYRVQEQRMPGLDGSGIDSVALWDLACPNSDGQKYLTQIPKGSAATPPTFDCANRPTSSSTVDSPWKIDYRYGIARSVVGQAKDAQGNELEAYAICRAARKSVGLTGDPQRCDAAGISNAEPCCIMSADDAAGTV